MIIIIIYNNNTFIDRRKPGWLITHTYIMPYISIECNLKDMNTNSAKAVNTCGSRACIKYRNLSFTLRKTKLGLSLHTILTRCSRNESYFGHTQTKWSSSSTLSHNPCTDVDELELMQACDIFHALFLSYDSLFLFW